MCQFCIYFFGFFAFFAFFGFVCIRCSSSGDDSGDEKEASILDQVIMLPAGKRGVSSSVASGGSVGKKAIRHGSQQHDLKVQQAAIIAQILSLTPEEVASLPSPQLKQYWALRAAHTPPLTPYVSGKWEYCPRVRFRLPGDTGRSAQCMDINNM